MQNLSDSRTLCFSRLHSNMDVSSKQNCNKSRPHSNLDVSSKQNCNKIVSNNCSNIASPTPLYVLTSETEVIDVLTYLPQF